MEPNELLLIRIDFISHISAHSIKTSNGRHFWQTVTFTCMTATNNAPVCSTPRWGWLGRLYWLLRMRNEAERGWKRKRRRWKSQVKTRVPLSLLVARRRRKKKHVRASQQLRQFARLHYSPGDIARNSTTFYSSSQQKWKEGKEKENSYCNNNNNKSMLMSVSTWILFLCFVFSLLAKGMRRWHRQAGDSRRGRLFLFCHPFPAGARHRENKTSKVASSQQPSHPFWFSSSKVVASLTRGHGRSVVRISRTALKVPFFPQPNQNKTKANDKSTNYLAFVLWRWRPSLVDATEFSRWISATRQTRRQSGSHKASPDCVEPFFFQTKEVEWGKRLIPEHRWVPSEKGIDCSFCSRKRRGKCW